jgi:phosphoglycerate dehydrogenase-like enzyme
VTKPRVLILEWLPEGVLARLAERLPDCQFLEARAADIRDRMLKDAIVTYGLLPVEKLPEAEELRWIQLISAGVPQELCPIAKMRGLVVTNLAGLYGASIAEHAVGMMLVLGRNLHLAMRNQAQGRWERTIARTMSDLHGKTLAVIGLGNIGQNIARLARALGMRVVGCRRSPRPTPYVDRLYGVDDLHAMLGEGDVVAVALPLTARTEGLLAAQEFAAMKKGVIYINVSRGGIARDKALLDALHSGQVSAAGFDVFAVEPLAADHPLWHMPQVLISPHVSGETINQSSLPAERFARNLASWLAGAELEGRVHHDLGY